MAQLDLQSKLAILADAAKYDASCASSGSSRRDSRGGKGLGSTEGMGICHAYAPDGRCISLLKMRLVLRPHLHRRRDHRALEGDDAAIVLVTKAQCASLPAQVSVGRVEEDVVLKPTGAERDGTSGNDCRSCRFWRVEPEFDLALEHQSRGATP